MNEELSLFNKIKNMVKRKEYYVDKEYISLGGRWCVDSWKKGDILYQAMDEGYTERLFIEGKLDVIKRFDNSLNYVVGSKECLEILIM